MEQLTALQQASLSTSGLGLRQRVCNLTRYSVCFFPSVWLGHSTEESFWAPLPRNTNTRVEGRSEDRPARSAPHKHARMAGMEDTMRASVPPWYGGLEGDLIYQRTTFIHEMSCGEVGSHLYSRMCCAGRCERCAPGIGGGSVWEGLLGCPWGCC